MEWGEREKEREIKQKGLAKRWQIHWVEEVEYMEKEMCVFCTYQFVFLSSVNLGFDPSPKAPTGKWVFYKFSPDCICH